MEGVIFRFHPDMVNMLLKTRFEGKNKEGKTTMLRLVEGDEELDEKKQSKEAKQKTFKVTGQEMFITDTATIEMLKARPDFGDLISIFDPVKDNKEQVEAIIAEHKIIGEVALLENVDTLNLGILVFGLESLARVKDGDYNGLKKDLIAYTAMNSEEVGKLLSDKAKSLAWFSAVAYAKDVVKSDVAGNSVMWASNDELIVNVTKGQKPIEALAEYLGTKEGLEVKQLIGSRLEAEAVDNKAKQTATKKVETAKP